MVRHTILDHIMMSYLKKQNNDSPYNNTRVSQDGVESPHNKAKMPKNIRLPHITNILAYNTKSPLNSDGLTDPNNDSPHNISHKLIEY